MPDLRPYRSFWFGVGFIFGATAIVWLLWVIPIQKWSKSPYIVHPSFSAVYDEFEAKLGSPTQQACAAAVSSEEAKRSAVIVFFDHGVGIWVRQKLTIYRLRKQGSKWEARRLATEVYGPKWFNEAYMRSQLPGFPDNKMVPFGGFAAEWAVDPDDWAWSGGMQWSCTLDGSKTYFQDFQNGHLAGPFPIRQDSKEGQIFVLLSDGSWESRRSRESTNCL